MMIDAKVIDNGQGLYVEIDTAIYPETVIDKVLYWYSSEYAVYRKKVENTSFEGITLVSKRDDLVGDWNSMICDLSDRLVDYKNRKVILEETRGLRELFFAKAFANSDDFVEFEFRD